VCGDKCEGIFGDDFKYNGKATCNLPCVPYQPELKAGDRVRILPTATEEKYNKKGNPSWSASMPQYIGLKTILKDADGRGRCTVENNIYTWLIEDLELLPPEDSEKEKDNMAFEQIYKSPFGGSLLGSALWGGAGGQSPATFPRLKPVKPPVPRYRWTGKPLTVWEVANEATAEELVSFWKNFLSKKGLNFKRVLLAPEKVEIPVDHELIEYASKSECFMDFLKNGYIEEVPDKLGGFFG